MWPRSSAFVRPALLLDQRADVNARASVDQAGIGGQTAIFHAVTQFDDGGLPMARLLVERGADLGVRAKLPGHYEQPDEIVECTPLGYALRFQAESQPQGQDDWVLVRTGGDRVSRLLPTRLTCLKAGS
jgi:hypothetical protein